MPDAVWLFLSGYLVVKVKGPNIELFINTAVSAGIPLWSVERITADVAILRTRMVHYRKLARAARRAGVRVRILFRGGLPRCWAAIRARAAFALGGALCVCLLYALSSFVWFVDIEGAASLDRQALLEAAQGAGLRPGVPRRAVDVDRVQRALLLEFDRLAWAAVRLRGSRAVVEVAEKVLPSVEADQPGHVVAARDGVITQIVPFAGVPLVRAGETVGRGQVLISGEIVEPVPGADGAPAAGETRQVHADGLVEARVWYEGTARAPLLQVLERPTGRR
ncbi:MAG TPA: sporulation protein YqfD, partial [Limnochordia bacterium]